MFLLLEDYVFKEQHSVVLVFHGLVEIICDDNVLSCSIIFFPGNAPRNAGKLWDPSCLQQQDFLIFQNCVTSGIHFKRDMELVWNILLIMT